MSSEQSEEQEEQVITHASSPAEQTEEEMPTVEHMDSCLSEEGEEKESEELEEEPEGSSRKTTIGFICVVILSALVLGLVIAVGYRLVPTTQKVSGKWQAEEGFPYALIVTGTKGKLVVDKLNGVSGAKLEVRSELKAIDGQHYKGNKTAAYLVIDKATQSKETIEALQKKTSYYQVTRDTKKTLELKYTKEATVAAFGVEDLTPLFRFEVTGWTAEVIPKAIRMQNEAFATNGVTFQKE